MPVKLQSPVKLSARKETASYQPRSVTTRSEELIKFQLSQKNNAETKVNLCAEAEVNN